MISPLACIDPGAKIGANVTIHPFVYIEKDVEIGDNCVLMPHVSVLNGTRMGKGNTVYHNAVLGSTPQDFHFKGDKTELIIGDNNSIRENVVIARATRAGDATRIGNNNFLMEGAHLCHDVKVNNYCVLGINSTVTGGCILDDYTILCSSVTLLQYCHTGTLSFIQSGCRISKDVPPYTIMSGNPAAYHGVSSVLLKHLNTTESVMRHITMAYRLVYQANFSVQDAVLKIKDQVPMSPEIQTIIDFISSSKRGIVK